MSQEDEKSSSLEIEDIKLSPKKAPSKPYTIENRQKFFMIELINEKLKINQLSAAYVKFITDFYYYCRYLLETFKKDAVKSIDPDSIDLSNIYDPMFKRFTNYKTYFDTVITGRKFNRNMINELSNKILEFVNDVKDRDLISIFKPFSEFFHRFLLIHDDSEDKKIVIHEINVYFRCTLADICKESNFKKIYDRFKDYKYEIIVASDFHLYYPKLLFPFILRGDIDSIELKLMEMNNDIYNESVKGANKDKNRIIYPFVKLKSEFNKNIKILLMGDYLYTPKPWNEFKDDRDKYVINNSDLENKQFLGILSNLTSSDRNIVCLTGNHDKLLLEKSNFKLYDYYKTKDNDLALVFMHWFLINKSVDEIQKLHDNQFTGDTFRLKQKTFVQLFYEDSKKKDYYNLNILADNTFRKFMKENNNTDRIYYILGHNGEKPAFEKYEYFINNCQYVDTPATSYYYWKKWNDHGFINRRINLHTKIIDYINCTDIKDDNKSKDLNFIVDQFYEIYKIKDGNALKVIPKLDCIKNVYNPLSNSLSVDTDWLENYHKDKRTNNYSRFRTNNPSNFSFRDSRTNNNSRYRRNNQNNNQYNFRNNRRGNNYPK